MKDVESVVVEFDHQAVKIYSELFDQFIKTVTSISRKKDENVFKLQSAKFLEELSHRLQREAKKSAEKYSGALHPELNSRLSTKVGFYLQKFRQKCSAW
jgi:hypothetical protein